MRAIQGIFDSLTNRVYKKVTVVSSMVFLAIAAMVTIGVLHYAQQRSLENLKRRVAQMALIGAEQSRGLLEDAVQHQGLTEEELFDLDYQRIGLEEFRSTYVRSVDQDRITDDYIRLLMDRVVEKDVDEYHRYHTAYDRNPILSERALQIQNPFLLVDNVDWALMVDRNAYSPWHHAAQALTGDLSNDILGNRTKRIWRAQGRIYSSHEITYSYFRRDSGIPYLVVSAPIVLGDRPWGSFVLGYRATEIDLAMARLRRDAMLLVLAFVAMTVVVYSISINISLRPLSALRLGVGHLEGGDLDVSVPVHSKDEFGYLARAFNAMVASVKSHAEDLRISNEKLEASNVELAAARDEAEAASRAKSSFLANIGHEFRTPLNAINGFAEILGSSLTHRDQQQQLAQIQGSSRSLVALVDRILEFSKSEANQISLVETPLDVLAYFGSIENLGRQQAASRGLAFSIDMDPGMPSVIEIDQDRLHQILDSLIDNAVKFTAQGHVAVRVRSMAGADAETVDLSIEVEDTGVGIPEDQHEEIFKAFTQARDQSINEYGGTGMGLALTQSLVNAMNGTISLTSQMGVGSTFIVTIVGVKVIDKQAVGDVILAEGPSDETTSAEGVGESPAEPLSPEAEAGLPELAQLLVQEQEHCADLARSLTINEVEAFADRMREMSTLR